MATFALTIQIIVIATKGTSIAALVEQLIEIRVAMVIAAIRGVVARPVAVVAALVIEIIARVPSVGCGHCGNATRPADWNDNGSREAATTTWNSTNFQKSI